MSGLHWPEEPPTVPRCSSCSGTGIAVALLPELAWWANRWVGAVLPCSGCRGTGFAPLRALAAAVDDEPAPEHPAVAMLASAWRRLRKNGQLDASPAGRF